jgi:myo-inositol-1(or 4)-monophosphatase
MSLNLIYEFAVETAYLAGRSTLAHFQTGVETMTKSDQTPVTIADRTAEGIIRSRIENRFPTHAILGEEFGASGRESASHRWIIDPIDGTKSFVRGVPLYGVLIGVEIEGSVEVGCVYLPALDIMLAAATGLGCWINGRRALVSTTTSLNQAYFSCTSVQNFYRTGRLGAWDRLQRKCYFQAGWGDAYGYVLAASGQIDCMLDPAMNIWDCAPFPPIFREAGGYFGDWQGNPTIYGNEGLATNPSLLPEIVTLLNHDS